MRVIPLLLLLLFPFCLRAQQWTQVENLPGVTTDLYFNQFGEMYVTKKNGVLLFEGDTFATYSVREDNELGLLAVTEYAEQVCVYLSGLDSLQHLICDNDTIVSIPYNDPHSNRHVGGDLVVQDDILYLSTGYGAHEFDAQDTTNLRGKIIAWNGDSLWIHSKGFRNPWRFDIVFDTIYVADVGDDTWEELNMYMIDSFFNGGWPCAEGPDLYFDSCGVIHYPVHGYLHPNDGSFRSITGIGYFDDHYFYTDFYTGLGFKWRKNDVHFMQTPVDIVSGAVDYLNQELYIISYDGRIYRYDEMPLAIDIPSPKPKIKKKDYKLFNITELIELEGDIYYSTDKKAVLNPRIPGLYFSTIRRQWYFVK